MEHHNLFADYRNTLDELIATLTDDPLFYPLMVKAEYQLDCIQASYGPEIYKGLEKCYLAVLMSKQERPRD